MPKANKKHDLPMRSYDFPMIFLCFLIFFSASQVRSKFVSSLPAAFRLLAPRGLPLQGPPQQSTVLRDWDSIGEGFLRTC